jgi:GH18 family chitinase
VIEKANYLKNQNLGGAMFWSLDSDDFNSQCGGGRFPLIAAVSNIVIGGGNGGVVVSNLFLTYIKKN